MTNYGVSCVTKRCQKLTHLPRQTLSRTALDVSVP